MQHFRKIWDDEKKAWIKTTKGMTPGEAYAKFLEAFPEVTDVTRFAFCNMRSRCGAAGVCYNPNFSRKPRPIGAEQVKKGYVRIKIAQPNVWISKAKYVYMQAHPGEDLSEPSNYIFLDGDNRNFAPENIERVPVKYMAIFCQYGGAARGDPETTRIRIAQAKIKVATLDLGEKIGVVVKQNNSRVFITDRNRKANEWQRKARQDPEKAERNRQRAREYLAKKRLDPEWRERRKIYAREWARNKRSRNNV